MTHFGILSPPSPGHLNPITTLGHELKQRDHRVTLFGLLDSRSQANTAGLDFWAIEETEYPLESAVQESKHLGEMSGIAALYHTMINLSTRGATFALRELPGAIKAAGVDALLIDQTILEGGTIAEYLRLPFITVCSALMLNPDLGVPPTLSSWIYDSSWWAYLCNLAAYAGLGVLGLPLMTVINKHRQQWNLTPYSISNDVWSQLAQLSQQPAEFEFPRNFLPQSFHFTGPFLNSASRESTTFPFEKLSGQPLIYASLGTIQNRLTWIFYVIAEACVGLDAQLVISLGGGSSPESLQGLPGSPLVVGYAPQLELLKKATLTITHAGLNTTLESLSNGVPIVAVPIANDQPGVAARIAWTGTGEVLPLSRLSVPRLRAAIQRVLTEDFYKKNALRLQEAIRRSGGVKRAADIVEQVIFTGKPVHG